MTQSKPQPGQDAADAADLRHYLRTTLGDTPGTLHVDRFFDPYINAAGKYDHHGHRIHRFDWPAQRDQAVEAILTYAPGADMYVCPYVLQTDKRSKGTAVERRHAHTDVDRDVDVDEVRRLGGYAIASGSKGHAQVYVPLAHAVTPAQHETLCRALTKRLGGDPGKISDNDLLRPPGTFNLKPTVAGGSPAPVQWLIAPTGARVDPFTLAEQLGVDISGVSSAGRNNSHGNGAAPSGAEPVDLDSHPRVAASVGKNTGDRSKDTLRIVGACYDEHLTLEQTRWVIHTRPDLAERLDDRHDDDVQTCWIKVINSRQSQTRTATNPTVKPQTGGHGAALDTFKKWLHISDTAPVLAVAATVVANLAEGDPVWFLLVGPPSGGKTEILSACSPLDYAVPAATITEAALLSGTSKKDRAKDSTGGLLRQVGDFGILLAKDFTSVLSQNKDTAKAAMAAMREIFDGCWDRPVGTDGGKVLHWSGKCGFVGGVTPSYDRYGTIISTLGDRYLLLRLPDVHPTKQADAALRSAQHEKQMRADLAAAMLGLINGADLNLVTADLDDDEKTRLTALAVFTARARTAVERDGYTGELLVMPQPEGPARIVKAMRQLYGALTALDIDADTRWTVLSRIALDCVPAIRLPLMRQLLAAQDWRRTAAIAEDARLVTKTAGRHLDDLALLKIAERTKQNQKTGEVTDNSPYLWQATDWLRDHYPQKVGQKTTTKREEELKDGVEEEAPYTPFRSSLSSFDDWAEAEADLYTNEDGGS